ncbi:GNAT family N-acetyltransferase [Pseudomonas sp. RL_105y_Pfl2_101]|uniref:GNAT family N-acetyltransferase n=1 Tax=Pseudomonas sp. RL_105y_Pfl2_101 TaxID=3088708 RepID=UPI0030DB02A8
MLFEALYLQHHETSEWLKEFPAAHDSFNKAYQAFLPKFKGEILVERRVNGVDHILNMDFAQNPIVLLGLIRKFNHPGVTISGLYVFPEYRGKGYARFIVDQIQMQTPNGYLQVAVEKSKLKKLQPFYESMGFKIAKGYTTDPNGVRLYDFFWSRRPIQILRSGEDIAIKPLA